MPTPTLDPTPGGANANTFADLDEYKTYWSGRLYNTAQLAASDATITAGLEWTGRLMNLLFKWRGQAATSTQSMAFPRTGLNTANGYPLDPTIVPQQLKDAQSEFTGVLIASGDRTTDDPSLKVMGSELNLTSIKAGPVSLGFGGGNFSTLESFDAFVRSLGSDFSYLSKTVPDAVRQMIPAPWYVEGQLKRKIIFGAF